MASRRRPRFVAARLTEARGARTYEDIASAAGRSHQTVRNWEAGRGEPDASDLAAIAAFTGHTLEFFFAPPEVA